MDNNILIIYQDIDSGAKVVTEEIISNFRDIYPNAKLIVYKQKSLKFDGALSAVKNFLWSLFDCIKVINKYKKTFNTLYTPYYLAAFAGSLFKKANQSIIFHFHGDHAITKIDAQPNGFRYAYIWLFGKIISRLQTSALNVANSVIFVAAEARREINLKYKLHLLKQRSSIVPNGVSLQAYHPINSQFEKDAISQICKTSSISKKATVLLYSGRIDQKKGIEKILVALYELKKYSSKEFILLVMYPHYKDKDSAKYFQKLKYLKKKYKLNVKFISHPKSLRPYYQLADFCILPSEQEMMPLVMLESLACGTPFFGTDVGNMRRVLSKINTNLILKNQDQQSIVDTFLWWQTLTSSERKDLQSKCIDLSKKYSWKSTAKKVMDVISQHQDQYHLQNQ